MYCFVYGVMHIPLHTHTLLPPPSPPPSSLPLYTHTTSHLLYTPHHTTPQPPPPDWPRRTTLHTLPTAALPPHPTPHDTLCVAALTSLAACANSVHDAVVFGGLVEGCVASLQRLVEDDGGGNGGGTGDRGGSGGGDRGDRGGRGSGGGVHTTATVGVHGIGGGEKQEQHAAHVLPYVEFLLCCLEVCSCV